MTYRFGEFTLDVDSRQLTRREREVPLVRKAFDLLVLLVESRPRVLSKTELHERLWPGTYVSDSSLSGLIGVLREALDDDPQQPRFIRTAHRVGYAFAGAVDVDVGPARQQRMPGACWLTLPNRQYALSQGENVIGRDPAAGVPLLFPGVSRRHARITIAGVEATIEDLDSKNGTWVRGERVTTPLALHDGDEVTIGPVALTFRAPDLGSSTVTAERR